MTDTIKLVEQPVGSGKTYHLIRKIIEHDGVIIYCAPTKALSYQVKNDIDKAISTNEYSDRNNTPIHIVNGEEIGYCSTVQERLRELILNSDDIEAIIVCTIEGIERVPASIISEAIDVLSKDITLIIDELPNLFSSYRHSFSGKSYKRLVGIVTVEDSIPTIDDRTEYDDTVDNGLFIDEVTKLLKLIPRGTVRLERSGLDNQWVFYGYDLKENLNSIMRHVQSVYLLAATIRETLDYVVLHDIWRFNLDDCKELNTRIDDNKVKGKLGNIRVYPLLDKPFSRSKASNKTYNIITTKMNSCLNDMTDNALKFIGETPSLIAPNNWGKQTVVEKIRGRDNIQLLPPNVKGINDYQDRHICCAIYSSKPDKFTNQSLQLMAEKYSLTKLGKAYTLQTELDMIVQMCGRTSIRNRDSHEICYFLVSDKIQAQHVLDTYVDDKSIHHYLLDESLMVKWSNYTNTKMGRPVSEERLEKARDMAELLEHAKSIGQPMKQKELVGIFDVQESDISKMLSAVDYKK